ncbi:MAG: hypothetical protein ACXWW4_09395, partial [Candidatus Binatia bacterium]
KEINLHALSNADVAAEFELRRFSLPAELSLFGDFIETDLPRLSIKEAAKKIRALTVKLDRGCRESTTEMIKNLRPTSTSK